MHQSYAPIADVSVTPLRANTYPTRVTDGAMSIEWNVIQLVSTTSLERVYADRPERYQSIR